MKETYIAKALKSMKLCHGLNCDIRHKCLRNNLEPNENQLWICPIKRGSECGYFARIDFHITYPGRDFKIEKEGTQ